MKPPIFLLAPSAALLLAASAESRSSSLGGVYTNVCVSSETLDLGGEEVQLSFRPAPHGTFARCEGGCIRSVMQDIQLHGDRLSFSTTEQDSIGGAVAGSTTHHHSGRFKANSLSLASSDDRDFARVILHRQSWKPDRLNLTGNTEEQSKSPSPIRRCR